MSEWGWVQWLFGAVLGMVAMIGGFIARDRQVMGAIKTGDDALHARISKVKDDYVRRADLDGHIKRLEGSVKDLRDDIRIQSQETNRRLDKIIAEFSKH